MILMVECAEAGVGVIEKIVIEQSLVACFWGAEFDFQAGGDGMDEIALRLRGGSIQDVVVERNGVGKLWTQAERTRGVHQQLFRLCCREEACRNPRQSQNDPSSPAWDWKVPKKLARHRLTVTGSTQGRTKKE